MQCSIQIVEYALRFIIHQSQSLFTNLKTRRPPYFKTHSFAVAAQTLNPIFPPSLILDCLPLFFVSLTLHSKFPTLKSQSIYLSPIRRSPSFFADRQAFALTANRQASTLTANRQASTLTANR